MEKIGKFTVGLLLYLVRLILSAFVLSQLWNWYLAFLGLPRINLWIAMGLSLTIRMIVGFKDGKKFEKYSDYIIATISSLLVILSFWGIGALITLFI